MSGFSPNLFIALFDFHPREGHLPRENFLTEGFAYVLRTSKPARDAWLSKVLERTVDTYETTILTRDSEPLGDTTVFPDMVIKTQLADGKEELIYSEHKWHAPCDGGQLQKYYAVAKAKSQDAQIVFIGTSLEQKRLAVKIMLGAEKKPARCFLWEDVFECLNTIPNEGDPILVQFIDFMKTYGLSPGEPLSLEKLQAYLEAQARAKQANQTADNFEQLLDRLANKLNEEHNEEHKWKIIPRRFHKNRQVTNRFGRIAIEFAADGWKPTITLGFLIDTQGHGVTYTNSSKGIDLLLRIEAMPVLLQGADSVKVVLRKKVPILKNEAASVLMVRERGNGNSHSLLLVRSCLWDVIQAAKSETEQLECLYTRLNRWLTILFEDGELEASFQNCGLNGGS